VRLIPKQGAEKLFQFDWSSKKEPRRQQAHRHLLQKRKKNGSPAMSTAGHASSLLKISNTKSTAAILGFFPDEISSKEKRELRKRYIERGEYMSRVDV